MFSFRPPFYHVLKIQNNFLFVATLENRFFDCFIKHFTVRMKSKNTTFFLKKIRAING